MTAKSWKDIALQKQTARNSCIPAKWVNGSLKQDMETAGYTNTREYLDSILDPEETSIVNLTMVSLISKISSGELSSVQVAEAYCHRAMLVHQILNCCSEIFVDKALEKAQELDEYYKKYGKVVGPLHGVPISLKDQFDIPGLDSSLGYVSLTGKPKTEISLLAGFLEKAGAVFYVKTTVPMAMMAPETVSNVNGYTFNSLNNKLTCGGSSGGEGALIAAGGSPMGFGTDLGGSIRIPASFQGLYALKPSTNRFSYLRISNSYSGQGAIPSVVGPMARSLQDIEYIAKLVLNGGLWETDPKVLPIPFREIEMSKLVIGIWKFDGKILPHPPLLRALHETSAALKAHGHEVVEIDFPSLQIIEVADRVYKADEGREVFEECKVSGEPIVPAVKPLITSTPGHQPLSVNEWWDVDNQSYVCKQQFLKFWSETAGLTNSGRPIDAIICPVWPSGAFLPGGPAAMNYSCPFNLLESPCAVLPVATASKTLDPVNTGYVPFDETDMLIQKAYDPELQDGLPVCLQVVGKKLDDEKVLAIASVVKSCLVADRGRF